MCFYFLFYYYYYYYYYYFMKHLMDEWTVMNKRSYLSHTQSLSPNWLKTKDMGLSATSSKFKRVDAFYPLFFLLKLPAQCFLTSRVNVLKEGPSLIIEILRYSLSSLYFRVICNIDFSNMKQNIQLLAADLMLNHLLPHCEM